MNIGIAISHVDSGKLEQFSGAMKSAFSRSGSGAIDTTVIDGVKPAAVEALKLAQNLETRLKESGIMSGFSVSRNDRGVMVH